MLFAQVLLVFLVQAFLFSFIRAAQHCDREGRGKSAAPFKLIVTIRCAKTSVKKNISLRGIDSVRCAWYFGDSQTNGWGLKWTLSQRRKL
jgi:hypothetical protein